MKRDGDDVDALRYALYMASTRRRGVILSAVCKWTARTIRQHRPGRSWRVGAGCCLSSRTATGLELNGWDA